MRCTLYIDRHTEAIFAPAIKSYTDLLLDRFIPLFDDVEGEQQRASEAAFNSYSWNEDEASAAESAYEEGISHAIMFMEMRTVFITTGVAGLFHLFEKQLYRFLNHDLARCSWTNAKTNKSMEVVIKSWEDAEGIIKRFSVGHGVKGQTLEQALLSNDMKELRKVANAVKHGPGKALDALHTMNAVVVDSSRTEADYTVGEFSTLGLAISIHPDDVIRYRDAILAFWAVRGTFEWSGAD